MSAEVTFAKESGERRQSIVLAMFVQESQIGRTGPVSKTGIDSIGVDHDGPVIDKTRGSRQWD